MKNRVAILFVAAALVASPSFADERSEVSMNELRAMDSTIDTQLEEAGFEGDADDLSMTVVVSPNEDDHSPNFSFAVHRKKPRRIDRRTGLVMTGIDKNVFSAGFVMSKVYYYGGAQITYGRYNPYKGKIAFHVDASASWAPEVHNVTLSFDPHIGRSGVFIGVSAQLLGIKPADLPAEPRLFVPALGIETGWRKAFGAVSVGGKVSFTGTNYNFQNYWWLSPEISVQWNLNGRSNHKLRKTGKKS